MKTINPSYFRSLTHNQLKNIIIRYIDDEYKLDTQVKYRIAQLNMLMYHPNAPKYDTSHYDNIYDLWSHFYEVAYDIYVSQYFGKPTTHNMYKGIVKLADILIQYKIDKLL